MDFTRISCVEVWKKTEKTIIPEWTIGMYQVQEKKKYLPKINLEASMASFSFMYQYPNENNDKRLTRKHEWYKILPLFSCRP